LKKPGRGPALIHRLACVVDIGGLLAVFCFMLLSSNNFGAGQVVDKLGNLLPSLAEEQRLNLMDAAPLDLYWNGILDIVRKQVSQQTFETWFQPLRPGRWEDGVIEVFCPDHFFLDWFSEHHQPALASAMALHFGAPTPCRLLVDEQLADLRRDQVGQRVVAPAGDGQQIGRAHV
jgi:hypothetical protein